MTDIALAFGLFLVILIFLLYVWWPRKSYIQSMHFLNLDKDAERREFMERQLPQAQRWSAVNGANLTPADMAHNNVSESVYSHRKNWDGKIRNAGVIGCWLSHVTLMRHLATLPASDNAAHIILEDDVTVTKPLRDDIFHGLPDDWDVVYLGITKPNIQSQVAPNLVKLKPYTQYGEGNFGTFAYAVRHGSLRTKILPFFTHFLNAIDTQMNQAFDRWNVYAIQPNIVVAESDHQPKSSIDENV